jgi:cellulose synthase/poly-beta-1,6-N-acetylglucosamine synthase-like glycosyltransferase
LPDDIAHHRDGQAFPATSVIIPHFDQPDQLERCLTGLSAQKGRAECEVIVVDNGSSKPPNPEMLKRHGATLLSEPEPGPGPARNCGVRSAKGRRLLFIDADCRPADGWILAAHAALDDPSCRGAIGGDVRIDFIDAQLPSAMETYEAVFAFRQKLYIEKHGYSGTGNLGMLREVYENVGPFAGISIAEDADWGMRAARAGHPISYVPHMIVFHPARRCFSELESKWQRHIEHGFAETGTGVLARGKWVVRACAVLLSIVPHAFQILMSRRARGIPAKLGGVGILIRIRLFRFVASLRVLAQMKSRSRNDWAR